MALPLARPLARLARPVVVLRWCSGGDDGGRKSRLRALYEDAALIRGKDAAVIGDTDPSVVIADRKISDAARRGVFDDMDGAGRPLPSAPHRTHLGAADRAGAELAATMAANSVAPRSVELARDVDDAREALEAAIRRTPRAARSGDASLRELYAKLDALVSDQHHAAIGDSLSFGGRPIQAPRFDFDAATEGLPYDAA